MKKIFVCFMAVILAMISILLTSCNMGLGMGNYTFNHVHISDCSGNCVDVDVDTWYDNENGIEVKDDNGNSMFLSEGTYILYEHECPICSRKAK